MGDALNVIKIINSDRSCRCGTSGRTMGQLYCKNSAEQHFRVSPDLNLTPPTPAIRALVCAKTSNLGWGWVFCFVLKHMLCPCLCNGYSNIEVTQLAHCANFVLPHRCMFKSRILVTVSTSIG